MHFQTIDLRHVALRFQGLNAKVSKASITEKNGWYEVKSCTCDKYYSVDISIGVCTCERGQDGSPCVHQAATVLYYGEESINYIATLSAKARLKLATIALGNNAIKQVSFYSSLHQQAIEEDINQTEANNHSSDTLGFEGSEWDLMRSNGDHLTPNQGTDQLDQEVDTNELIKEVDSFASDLKLQIQQKDQQLISGVRKILTRYKGLSAYRSTARLASAFHQFGWVFGGVINRTTLRGSNRHGKRITVQATSAGRRRVGSLRGKSRVPSGRPCTFSQSGHSSVPADRHLMPTRKQPKGKSSLIE